MSDLPLLNAIHDDMVRKLVCTIKETALSIGDVETRRILVEGVLFLDCLTQYEVQDGWLNKDNE